MLSFEPELERLRPLLGDTTADALIARERREVFSLHPEVRLCAWGGAMLLATAAGLVLKNNLDRIGPLALAALMGLAAIACYAFAWRRRDGDSVLDDYLLLLGALVLSADLAFIESQFELFGAHWYRQFLVAAVIHGVTAYLYRSRTLLSLSIVAVAAWMGVQQNTAFDSTPQDLSLRLLGCVCIVAVWRSWNRRAEFTPVLEQFGAHFLLLTPTVLIGDDELRLTVGCPLALLFSAMVIAWGVRDRREMLVITGFLYGLFAADAFLIDVVGENDFTLLLIVLSIIGAIAGLFTIHSRFRELRA